MDRSADLLIFQIFPASDAIDFALPSEPSYVPSCEAAANGAANEECDECEQDSSRLNPVNELLKIDHWKPGEPQFCKEIAAHSGQSKRNIQKWFVDLREIAPWFMVLHTGSSLALPAIPGIVSPGNDTAYLSQIQQRMQEFEALQQEAIAQMQEQFHQA